MAKINDINLTTAATTILKHRTNELKKAIDSKDHQTYYETYLAKYREALALAREFGSYTSELEKTAAELQELSNKTFKPWILK